MDMFVKKSIENFKGLTSCNVVFTVGKEKMKKKLRFYFSYMKENDIFYIVSLDFISMDKINDWSKIESSGQEAIVNAINESISNQLSFFVAYYKDNFNNRDKLVNINRNISATLNIFYTYMDIRSKISKSVKKISNHDSFIIGNKHYEGVQSTITYI